MKISEIIQRIQSLYSKGVDSDDTRLSNRHIYNKIVTTLDFVIFKNKVTGFPILDESLYQILDCQKLVKANIIECPCANPINCDILRTECEIPEIKSSDNKYFIQSITSIDGYIKFNETTFEYVKYLDGNKYSKQLPFYFINNNYLYLINGKKIKNIRIKAIFSDPVAVSLYKCNDNTNNCISALDTVFPASNKIIEQIIELSVDELVYKFSKMQEDLTNDSKDSRVQTSK